MNTLKSWILITVIGVSSLTIACSTKDKKTEAAEVSEKKQVVKVSIQQAVKESISRNIDYTATLVPFQEVHLAPAAPGRIETFNVKIGSHVSQGQIVAVMDRTNLEQAKINLMKLKTDLKRADTLKRMKSIAEQQYEQIKTAYDVAKNSYDFLLKNTQLKAPFEGVVSGKYFEQGEIYSGSPVPTIGKAAIVSIVQIKQLKALLGINSAYYPMIKQGMKTKVKTDIYPDAEFEGEICNIYPTVDNATKTFTVEVKINNANMKLRPGMFAKIELDLGKGEAVLVPTIALIKQTGTNDMYIFVNKNNVAEKRLVKIGRIVDDKTEVLEGLNEGEEVITIGQNKLEHNMLIDVVK